MPQRIQPKALFVRKKIVLAACVAALAVLMVLIAGVGYAAYYRARIVQGVFVSGIPLGGYTVADARTTLEQFIHAAFQDLALTDGDGIIHTTPSDLGMAVRLDDALEEAYMAGRKGNGVRRVKEMLAMRHNPRRIRLAVSFDEHSLSRTLAAHFGNTIERPAKNASLVFDTGRLSVTPATDGVVVDRAALQQAIENRLNERHAVLGALNLSAVPNSANISTDQAQALKNRIERILNAAPYFLFGNGKRFVLSQSTLSEWLEIHEGSDAISFWFSVPELEAHLTALAPAMSRASHDAELAAEAAGEAAHILKPSEDALRLNINETAKHLSANLYEARRNTDAVLDTEPAPINERMFQEKGITHLLSRGVSDFAGSSRSRIQNIRVAAEKYRGMFLAPGEAFSFNDHLGDISQKGGYVPELVIKQNKLIPEYGGGICQVSTTMFRAAVYAGLKVTERFNHSIPVRYYGVPGFDATVYPPSPNLAFVNSTSSTLYIQPRIAGTRLFFELYGTPDGRRVEVDGPIVTQKNPDGSMKTAVVQRVLVNEELVQKKTFWSFYKNPAQYTIERNPLE